MKNEKLLHCCLQKCKAMQCSNCCRLKIHGMQ
ncbi:hypothetical protein V6Z12_A12G152200 [Gossypium hirsutum]